MLRQVISPRLISRIQSVRHGAPNKKSSMILLRQKSTTPFPHHQEQQIIIETVERVTIRDRLRSILLKPRTIPVPRWISPRHYTMTLSEICGHSSFILVAISYAVDDFLHLRILAVAGSSVMLCFTYFHPHGRVLWLPFRWNALFIAINSYRIGKAYADRYYAENLSQEMKRVRDEHLYVLDPPDFKRMFRIARIEDYKAGEMITSQGEFNPYIRFVVGGELSVLRDGLTNYVLKEGNFVAECGLHAGLLLPGEVESCCSIVAKTNCRVLCWERDSLMDLLHREKGLRRALKAVVSWDIVSKLKGQRLLFQKGLIDGDAEAWTKRRTEQSQHRYAAILQNCLSHPAYMNNRKEELKKLRMMHHIDDEHHKQALERHGWKVEEFERGYKDGQELPELDADLNHDWKWHATNVFMKIFG